MADDDVVEVSLYIAAQPETVFPYFTDPGRYIQWMGSDATLQPVPGGAYHVYMQDGVEAVGEFVEIDPPRRVVFTCTTRPSRPGPPASSSPCTPNRTAPASSCVTTTCLTTGSAIITARAGRSTSAGSGSWYTAAIPAPTRTPDRRALRLPAGAGQRVRDNAQHEVRLTQRRQVVHPRHHGQLTFRDPDNLGTVQHILALSRSAVTIRHWFETDLDDASMEHGARDRAAPWLASPARTAGGGP